MHDESPDRPDIDPGLVRLTFAVGTPPGAVWRALTDADLLRDWFGRLSAPLRDGGSTVLDFGDGDFFAVRDVQLRPPSALGYAWRFLGIGPLDRVSWRLAPSEAGCSVTLLDERRGRPADAAALLREGWLDFTDRLAQFLETRRPTRYDWRREFDGWIELPAPTASAAEALIRPSALASWLPLDGATSRQGARLILADATGTDRFEIAGLRSEARGLVSFEVRHPDWASSTRCELALSETRGGSLLAVRHVGWEEIGGGPDEPRRQRRRFARLWTDALKQARRLCGVEARASGPATRTEGGFGDPGLIPGASRRATGHAGAAGTGPSDARGPAQLGGSSR